MSTLTTDKYKCEKCGQETKVLYRIFDDENQNEIKWVCFDCFSKTLKLNVYTEVETSNNDLTKQNG